MQRLPVLLALALGVVLAASLAVSCASGGAALPAPSAVDDGSPVKGSGTISVSLRWPERSSDVEARLVPVASESVKIRAVDPATGEDVGTSPLVLTRPAPGEALVSSGAITNLPLGDVEFEASAHPDEAGEGLPVQASATVVREIAEGHNTDLPLTMASTITEVALSPAAPYVPPGESRDITAVAKDADGEIVLTGDTWEWDSSDPLTAAAAASTSNACEVSGLVLGSAEITATETESAVEATVRVAVEVLTKVAWVSFRDGDADVYVANVDGSDTVNVSGNAVGDSTPCISADNTKVAWESNQAGGYEVLVASVDGTGLVNVSQHDGDDWAPSLSADGGNVAWASQRDGNWEVYVASTDGTGLVNVSQDAGVDNQPSLSADGARVAWVSRRDGTAPLKRDSGWVHFVGSRPGVEVQALPS